jgi:hypothetical protein
MTSAGIDYNILHPCWTFVPDLRTSIIKKSGDVVFVLSIHGVTGLRIDTVTLVLYCGVHRVNRNHLSQGSQFTYPQIQWTLLKRTSSPIG